jgi:excisionase family DNA binding protein
MTAEAGTRQTSPLGVEPEFYTPEELSRKLNLAKKTIKKWTQARRIPGQLKCGGRWRYSRLAIEKAILRGELLNP